MLLSSVCFQTWPVYTCVSYHHPSYLWSAMGLRVAGGIRGSQDRARMIETDVCEFIVLSTVNLSTTPVYPCQCAYVSLHNASVPTSPCTTPVSPVLLAQVRTLLSSCSGILFLHDTARTFSLPGQPVLKFTRLTTQCLIETY